MATARDIITRAMKKAGILTKDEVPASDEAADALDDLNDMISEWSNNSSLIYVRKRESFPLTGGTGSYTIGTGQTFNTIRPMKIADAYLTQVTTDFPLTVITDEVYDSIPVKTTQGLPMYLNYDNGYPTGVIRLYPVPSASYTLNLLTEKPIASSFALDDAVDLPPGWKKALIYNLAMTLAPEYGQQADPAVKIIADSSLGAIKRAVLRNRTMDAQAPAGIKGNVYNGWFR